MRKRRLALYVVWTLCLLGLVEVSRRVVFSRSLYQTNLSVGAHLPELDPIKAGERMVIFAPHPDDETLGAGGLIQQAVAAGAQVTVVLMTNGEVPEISVVISERTLRRRPEEFVRLGYARQAETLAGIGYLGLPLDAVTFLGYPNGYLDRMWLPEHWLPDHPVKADRTRTTRSPYSNSLTPHAVFCGRSVLDDVESLLLSKHPDIVVTLHPGDVHPDHWPTYTFVRLALEELRLQGQDFARTARLYTYLIHRQHWPVPRRYQPWRNLEPPASLLATGDTQWRALPLSLGQTLDKHNATRLYVSQGGSIDPLLLSFARSNELFGLLAVRPWPEARIVPLTLTLSDPVEDMDSLLRRPAADVVRVKLGRERGQMVVEVTTRGAANPRITMHLSLVACDGRPADRTLAHFTWRGNKAQGLVVRGEGLYHVPADQLFAWISAHESRLRAPWLVPEGRAAFLIRVWTTTGARLSDQTGVATFRVGEGNAER